MVFVIQSSYIRVDDCRELCCGKAGVSVSVALFMHLDVTIHIYYRFSKT